MWWCSPLQGWPRSFWEDPAEFGIQLPFNIQSKGVDPTNSNGSCVTPAFSLVNINRVSEVYGSICTHVFSHIKLQFKSERQATMSTMKALVYKGNGKTALEDKPIPTIQEPTDLIVKLLHTTICGTDLHILKGKPQNNLSLIS